MTSSGPIFILGALLGLGAPATARPQDPPCFWFQLTPPEAAAPGDPSMAVQAMDAPAATPWLERLVRAAALLVEVGARAELVVTRWPEQADGSDAQWLIRLRPSKPEEARWAGAAEAWAKAASPTTQPRGWSMHDGVLMLAGGPDAAARAQATPAPFSPEFEAHRAAQSSAGTAPPDPGPAALWIDLNALRRQASDTLAHGPEARLLDRFQIPNARAVGVWAHLASAKGDGPRPLTVDLTWSARSTPPGTVRKVTLGEGAWPPGVAAPPAGARWAMIMRADAGSSVAARGWGGWMREVGALALAARPGLHTGEEPLAAQQAWYMARSGHLRDVTSRLDRWLIITPAPREGLLEFAAPLRESARGESVQLAAALEAVTKGLEGVAASPDARVRWSWPGLGLGLQIAVDPQRGATVDVSVEHHP